MSDRSITGYWNNLDILADGLNSTTDKDNKAQFDLTVALKSTLFLRNGKRAMPALAPGSVNDPVILDLSQDLYGRTVSVRRNVQDVPLDEWGRGRRELSNVLLPRRDLHCFRHPMLSPFGPFMTCGHTACPTQQPRRSSRPWRMRKRRALLGKAIWHNATVMPYVIELQNEDSRLSGEKMGIVEAGGILGVCVLSHAAKAFRLRRILIDGEESKGQLYRSGSYDELSKAAEPIENECIRT
ncbi:alpha-galactosidase [Apiospora rasikravindrae]|uniref:Alpha-galactosidase n=1 Tax=Apiospora rasikravindrae TaxID=990691 RepID=A0ABR1TCW0_9PEZI